MKTQNTNRGFVPIVIAIIVVIGLAAGSGYYVSKKIAKNKEAKQQAELNATSTTSVNAKVGINQGTIRQLLSAGNNVMCTVDAGTATSSIKGTAYISGSMMRGDFTMKGSSSTTVDSHIIRNGNDVYAWSGSQGVRMNINVAESQSKSTSFDLDQKVEYSCKDWQRDVTVFVPPTTINFIDFTKLNVQSKVTLPANIGY